MNLYVPDAIVSWNGNIAEGQLSIADHLGNLPMSTCTIHSVDAQPINEKVCETYIIVQNLHSIYLLHIKISPLA